MLRRSDLIDPIKYVVDHSQHVHVDQQKIDDFVTDFQPVTTSHWQQVCPFKLKNYQDIRDEIDFRFLVDSQAFCFWGFPNKWTASYQGKKLDGWWAMLASFQRAQEQGLPIFEGSWLSQLNSKQTRDLFQGEPEIPLLSERHQMLNQIGQILVEKYKGRFHNFLELKKISALDFLTKFVKEFPGFDDVHEFHGQKIRFYKKAQLFIYDLASISGINEMVQINELDQLTGKADYKIPWLLRKYGILEYSDQLRNLVDNKKEITSGSEMEIEIRASMLWTTKLISAGLKQKNVIMPPIELDNILWVMSQDKSPNDSPYHLTLTIDY